MEQFYLLALILPVPSITIFQPQVYLATAIAHRVPLFITILINSLALMYISQMLLMPSLNLNVICRLVLTPYRLYFLNILNTQLLSL